MIPSIEAISVDSVTYVALAGGLAALAWSRWKKLFLYALVISGVLLALSWLSWKALIAMGLFMIPPYLVTKLSWGQKDRDVACWSQA